MMNVYFKPGRILVVKAVDTVQSMALELWLMEYAKHGDAVLEIETELPIMLDDRS